MIITKTKPKPYVEPKTRNLACPKCHSPKVQVDCLDITCLGCGYSEPLMDFPISHEHYRGLCCQSGRPVPPHINEPPLLFTRELKELESGTVPPIPGPTAQPDQLTQIKGQLQYYQKKIIELSSKSKKSKKYEVYKY